MNKIGKAMLCTVLTGAMAVGAAGAADLGSLSPQGAKAYLNQITTLQNKYGKAAARTDDGFKGLLTGLSMAKLVDMDGDKIPELYCGAGLEGQHMYSYADGKIYALDIPEGAEVIDVCKAVEEMMNESEERGELRMLVQLVRDGDLKLERAAEKAKMTVEQLEKVMKNTPLQAV